MQTSADNRKAKKPGKKADKSAAKTADPWEFLGRMTAELGWSHSAKSLEDDVKNLAPDQAKGLVNGYVGWLLDNNGYFTAHAIMEAMWTRFIIDDRDNKKHQALEGIVSKALPEKHKEDSEDEADFRNAEKIIVGMIGTKYARICDLAQAAEKNNPEIAIWIYNSQGAAAEAERVARAVFKSNPQLTFSTITDTDKRLALIKRLLGKKKPTREDCATAYNALDQTQAYGEPKQRLYARIAEVALKTDPMLAFNAAKYAGEKDLLHNAMTNLIQMLGGENPGVVRTALDSPHHLTHQEVKEALIQLATVQYAAAKKKGGFWKYKDALEAFRKAHYEGPEKEECIMQLLTDTSGQNRESMPYITSDEIINAGLALVETKPKRAYDLLSVQKKDPRARQAMGRLSERLEAEGCTEDAYMAELNAAEPRMDRVETLTMNIIAASKDRMPYVFGWRKDAGAMIGWYDENGHRLNLEERYKTALEISNLVEDDCLVQPAREELIRRGFKEARHAFHFNNDATGIAMLRAYVLQQAQGLAEHEEAMTDILGLRTREEAERLRQKRN